MLNSHPIIAFVPASDFERAHEFYVGKLGLDFVSNDGFAIIVRSAGTTLRIVKAGDFKPAKFTILGWETPDIAQTRSELASRGIAFQNYGLPGQDEFGIWTAPDGSRVAWFHDPDGNVLSISQHRS